MTEFNPKLRYLAAYQIPVAARYLRMSPATLRHWILKNQLLKAPESRFTQLSFMNLVEAHVLSALRNRFNLSMQKIRIALNELQDQWPEVGDYPLATETFFTDGKFLMVEKLGKMINLNKGSQLEMRHLIDEYLHRIERDELGPVRLNPFTVDPQINRQRANRTPVLISPYISFGRPAVAGSGVATEVIYDRFIAGDTQKDLAEDYTLSPVDLEEILRYEATIRSAA